MANLAKIDATSNKFFKLGKHVINQKRQLHTLKDNLSKIELTLEYQAFNNEDSSKNLKQAKALQTKIQRLSKPVKSENKKINYLRHHIIYWFGRNTTIKIPVRKYRTLTPKLVKLRTLLNESSVIDTKSTVYIQLHNAILSIMLAKISPHGNMKIMTYAMSQLLSGCINFIILASNSKKYNQCTDLKKVINNILHIHLPLLKGNYILSKLAMNQLESSKLSDIQKWSRRINEIRGSKK